MEEFRHAEAKVSVTSMAHRNRKNLLVTAVRIIRTEKFSSQLEIPLIRMSLNRSQINDLNISQWDVLAGYE